MSVLVSCLALAGKVVERREIGWLGGGMRLVDDTGAPILLRGAGGFVPRGGGMWAPVWGTTARRQKPWLAARCG